MEDYRGATRIAVSRATLTSLKGMLRGGETYDTLLRRMMITWAERTLSELTDDERVWVLQIPVKV